MTVQKFWIWILSIYQNQTEWSENVFKLKLYSVMFHACSSPDFTDTFILT